MSEAFFAPAGGSVTIKHVKAANDYLNDLS